MRELCGTEGLCGNCAGPNSVRDLCGNSTPRRTGYTTASAGSTAPGVGVIGAVREVEVGGLGGAGGVGLAKHRCPYSTRSGFQNSCPVGWVRLEA